MQKTIFPQLRQTKYINLNSCDMRLLYVLQVLLKIQRMYFYIDCRYALNKKCPTFNTMAVTIILVDSAEAPPILLSSGASSSPGIVQVTLPYPAPYPVYILLLLWSSYKYFISSLNLNVYLDTELLFKFHLTSDQTLQSKIISK